MPSGCQPQGAQAGQRLDKEAADFCPYFGFSCPRRRAPLDALGDAPEATANFPFYLTFETLPISVSVYTTTISMSANRPVCDRKQALTDQQLMHTMQTADQSTNSFLHLCLIAWQQPPATPPQQSATMHLTVKVCLSKLKGCESASWSEPAGSDQLAESADASQLQRAQGLEGALQCPQAATHRRCQPQSRWAHKRAACREPALL